LVAGGISAKSVGSRAGVDDFLEEEEEEEEEAAQLGLSSWLWLGRRSAVLRRMIIEAFPEC